MVDDIDATAEEVTPVVAVAEQPAIKIVGLVTGVPDNLAAMLVGIEFRKFKTAYDCITISTSEIVRQLSIQQLVKFKDEWALYARTNLSITVGPGEFQQI